jgi:hypothetical protein
MNMVKKVFLAALLFAGFNTSFSQRIPPTYGRQYPSTYSSPQQEDTIKGFKKENLYIGGSLGLGFASGQFSIGANPEVGYSVRQWLDLGLMVNLNYSSYNGNYYNLPYNTHVFNYGAGVYARAYPLKFLFVQLQPEENWTSYSYSNNAQNSKTINALSLIGGIGYSQREIGRSGYYIMLGLDFLRNTGSPYLDITNSPIPIIRAGFNFYLHPRH